jgi:hypothetical protein
MLFPNGDQGEQKDQETTKLEQGFKVQGAKPQS